MWVVTPLSAFPLLPFGMRTIEWQRFHEWAQDDQLWGFVCGRDGVRGGTISSYRNEVLGMRAQRQREKSAREHAILYARQARDTLEARVALERAQPDWPFGRRVFPGISGDFDQDLNPFPVGGGLGGSLMGPNHPMFGEWW